MSSIARLFCIFAVLTSLSCDTAIEPLDESQVIKPASVDGLLLATISFGESNIAVRAAHLTWTEAEKSASLEIYMVNLGPGLVSGPVNLVLTSVDPTSIVLLNADGTSADNRPYRRFESAFGDDDVLSVGENSTNVTYQFDIGESRSFSATFRIDEASVLGEIHGNVFADSDEDGVWGNDETGAVGIELLLHSSNPTFAAVTAETDELGHYAFRGLQAGAYTVTIELAEGVVVTTAPDVIVALLETDEGVASQEGVNFGIAVSTSSDVLSYDFNDGTLPPWRGPAGIWLEDGTLKLTVIGPEGWKYEKFSPHLRKGSVEFSVKCSDPYFFMDFRGPSESEWDNNWGPFIYFASNGNVEARDPGHAITGFVYELDTWYRVRLSFDNDKGLRGQYDFYITNMDAGTTEVHLGVFDYYATNGRLSDLRQLSFGAYPPGGTTAVFYLDDVKLTSH